EVRECVKCVQRVFDGGEGWDRISYAVELLNDLEVSVYVTRFLSLDMNELGAINFELQLLNADAEVIFAPYLDSGITNKDANWEEKFWKTLEAKADGVRAFITAKTLKTEFHACTFMESRLYRNHEELTYEAEAEKEKEKVVFRYKINASKGDTVSLQKYGGYVTDMNHDRDQLVEAASNVLSKATDLGFDKLLELQKEAWGRIWERADITIEGDVKAQQGIRFNIFQLNQTYLGEDERLNIGPKGFTGEKYGGSTYWDTEAYCIPFYMATKDQQVARNLLTYRYNHLGKAIENAEKL